jgi:hypothetical protein
MAQIPFRVNLNAANFPFLSELGGQTIIIPGVDQTNPRQRDFAGTNESADLGIPQILYAHNVLPKGQGFTSIGFKQLISPFAGATDFDQAMEIRDIDENRFIFSPAQGKNYLYNANTGAWVQISPFAAGEWKGKRVTKSNINGRTFIFFENRAAYEYNSTTATLTLITFTGINSALVVGILASNNYNIVYSKDTISWSSLIDETDFVPSLSTGAGAAIPQDLKGEIIGALPISGGFMIYTTRNILSALYSNNTRFPWIFREVPNSGGVETIEHIGYESNLGFQYGWTSAGLQEISNTGAKVIQPEVADFIGAKRFEDYNIAADLFSVSNLGSQLKIKLALVDSRYLVISYGVSLGSYTHCIVYDIALKRWGKIKITHVDCFDYPYPNVFGSRTYGQLLGQTYDDLQGNSYYDLGVKQITVIKPKTRFGFLQQDGSVYIVDFAAAIASLDSILMLGKFQVSRTHHSDLQEVVTEMVHTSTNNFVLSVKRSLDGKTLLPRVLLSEFLNAPELRKHRGRVAGQNHTILYSGAFDLVSSVVTLFPTGYR